jgi:ubiquinone/menaquinone biosynthesis C-methylase UbiE
MDNNKDTHVIKGFGEEWKAFDQSLNSISGDLRNEFQQYFSVFPWWELPENAVGVDIGCGSGRWAKYVAPLVGKLYCCDPSEEALNVAKINLAGQNNCEFYLASVNEMPFAAATMDFGYSLGVLHHIPDTEAGLKAAVSLLKPGAPFLVYLYYSFDNRPNWFKALHRISEIPRKVISKFPFKFRLLVSQFIATTIYFPLAKSALIFEKLGFNVEVFPLSAYRKRSFYSMRTDSLDRFGTQLEHRFSRQEIEEMMLRAGLINVSFRDGSPYWCAIGIKGN